ncbi:programmed cell death protein 2-like [Hydractinia symbiolongicarpus]|uniref:programmed cell death protein 2-like n=1 Tax=Hydractinia symbiolongicarpus TaxID=13093 RepID=UPI00255175F0|nr:programmed cell death protein 2-like [Hydractinia symbiolongicarpus]
MSTLLGLLDCKINQDTDVDWTCNMIGGYPIWMTDVSEEDYPRCQLCGTLLYPLTQVYCPLETSKYHRALYVFACTTRSCWNKHESVVVWRCQKLDIKENNVANSIATKISTDDWGVNDWSDDDGDDHNQPKCTNNEAVDTLSKDLNAQLAIKPAYKPAQHFVGYHMYVISEKDAVEESSNEHEMRLYDEYINRVGDRPALNGAASNTKEKNENKANGERYEKTELKHGDRGFYQFQKRIRKSPAQCIRYELNGEALFLSSVSPVTNHVRNCQYCGLERVFELQLMPYMVSCLHQVEEQPRGNGTSPVIDMNETKRKRTDSGRFCFSDSDYENRVEFGCIYVYTCKASCWSDDDIFRQELVCVQADPDDAILT